MNPNMLAFTAFNPHSASIPVTRVAELHEVNCHKAVWYRVGQRLWIYGAIRQIRWLLTQQLVWCSIGRVYEMGLGPRNPEQAEGDTKKP